MPEGTACQEKKQKNGTWFLYSSFRQNHMQHTRKGNRKARPGSEGAFSVASRSGETSPERDRPGAVQRLLNQPE